MTEKKQNSTTTYATDSWKRASDLNKSFQGAGSLQEASQQQASSQSTETGAAAMRPKTSESGSESSDS